MALPTNLRTSWLLTISFLCIWTLRCVNGNMADMGRVKSYLARNCDYFASFLKPSCEVMSSPPCCTIFAMVDICRASCAGDFDSVTSESLRELVHDPAICSQLQLGGKRFCTYTGNRDSPNCEALKCFMNLVCFGHTQCDHVPYYEPEVAAFRANFQSRNFELPEMAACEATNLIGFDPYNNRECPSLASTSICGTETRRYRTIDGSCNNLQYPDWGKSFAPPKRYLAPVYEDGVNAPRTLGKNGVTLKSTRYISHYVAPEVNKLTGMSVITMSFGQFIDHDFTGFPVIKLNSTDIQCCDENLDPDMMVDNGGPCFPIAIGDDEDFYYGQKCMEFVRSNAAMDEHDNYLSPREQINGLTSFLDGSAIYGSTEEVNAALRGPGGKLKVERNNMLPRSEKMNCKIEDENTDYCLFTGDHRVNVFVGLGIFHTIFHREHNRLVDGLAVVNPHWDDETLYQEARRIVSALLQHYTYKEYLPALFNDDTMIKYRLHGGSYLYDSSVEPNMANVFSTAAFRFGHSQIADTVKVGNSVHKMEDTLMRPHLVLTQFDEVLEGMAFTSSEEVDKYFVRSITDRLFENNGTMRDGLDLVALNIQRGRDHGLPALNRFREWCGLEPITSFDSPELQENNQLNLVYDDVDDIDIFIGGVVEKHVPGGITGPTFACILGQQFHDIKFGDRFWYETGSPIEGFTLDQLNEIKSLKLASTMCANSGVDALQWDMMFVPDDTKNPLVPCEKMPQIDLRKWTDIP